MAENDPNELAKDDAADHLKKTAMPLFMDHIG